MEVVRCQAIRWFYHDGGREAAGYQGSAGDCVCRAIAIALQLPYQQVYDELNQFAQGRERWSKHRRKRGKLSHSRTGVYKPTFRRYLESKGWEWVPTMFVGSGCKVHLRESELPSGRLVVSLSRHVSAVIDGVVYDTHDPSRDGTRCVYGYFKEGN